MTTPGFRPFARAKLFRRRVTGRARSIAGMLLFAGALPLLAQTNFYTITTNGPASNRVNLMILAEGYRNNQYDQFLADATTAATILLTNPPFAEYRAHFNTFAIAVPSVEAGSDHPSYPAFKNTYFNSTFGPTDYYLSIPANGQGQGKVDALITTYLPQADLVVMLVNDPLAGGSDGGGKTAIVSRRAIYGGQFEILTHETGHVLAGLGDEYTTPNPGYPDTEEPNTTRETNRAAIKWTAWIDASTPVPTPTTNPNIVGLFEGAHYQISNWYRPKLNCLMRNFGVGFCEVCQEALVLSFYRQVRPIDSALPNATHSSVGLTQALSFSVSLIEPTGHALTIQWLTNGTPVPEATNTSLALPATALGYGSHTVSGRVTDPTAWVRTDTSNWLSQTLTWTVTVIQPQLQLTASRWLGPGGFTFRVAGVAPQGFAILASTNLVHWQSVATNTLVSGQYDYTNTSGTNLPRQFFRAATPP